MAKSALASADYHQISNALFILVVEDNPADVLLLEEAFRFHEIAAQVFVAEDGDEAIRLLAKIDGAEVPCPDIAVLDINLPKRDGSRCWPKFGVAPDARKSRR